LPVGIRPDAGLTFRAARHDPQAQKNADPTDNILPWHYDTSFPVRQISGEPADGVHPLFPKLN
jgi:hypothetical protein